MKHFKNVHTGNVLTEVEYNEMLEREYKEMYQQKSHPAAEECETEEEFILYMKERDVDTDYGEVEVFFINYHTGAGNETVMVNDLQEAKEIAKEGIRYTQQNVTIENVNGDVICTARWYALSPEEEDHVLEHIGGGFYQIWDDELGE